MGSFVLLLFASFLVCGFAHDHNPNGDLVIKHKGKIESPSGPVVWPQPQQMSLGTDYMTISPNHFTIDKHFKHTCEILNHAIHRYRKLFFLDDCSLTKHASQKTLNWTSSSHARNARVALTSLAVKMNGNCEHIPHMNMDEMYTIRVNVDEVPGQAYIAANSVWGILRGLETFSQLIQPLGNRQFAVPNAFILDYPRFSHRGILLDTSRHFLPLSVIYENIDAMIYNKLNVFHWHIVDDQSFPFVSKKFPNLSKLGSYDPATHIYSPQDVHDVIEYARVRGIRVLAEFDSPGHTQAWGKGQPNLLTTCYTSGKPDGTYGPVDPTKDTTYTFIRNLFSEVVKVFPDSYLHLGGDEVNFDCWKSNPDISNFMTKKNITGNYAKLEEYYMQNVLDIVKNLSKSYIVWQEVFDNGVKLRPDTVVHVWKSGWQADMKAATAAGYHVLLSTCWYLNYISYGEDWPQYYTCDPQNFGGTEAENKLVLGGEAAMWAEMVDASNVISRTWPRAAAVAERLWSQKTVTDVNSATARIDNQHCRMLQRGINVEPLNGPGFCKCDFAL